MQVGSLTLKVLQQSDGALDVASTSKKYGTVILNHKKI